jgi:hypothetical protein
LYVVVFGGLLFLPALARAQAASSIAGLVTDATGAVLPGVTVETTSPALIEKVRSAITDGQGQYRIVDLPPGRYRVTFALPGFGGLTRDGIDLGSGFTATINAQLSVGDVTETITVSGQGPLVDVQNTRAQQVLTNEVINVIPNARGFSSFVALTPGIRQNPSFHDVGGMRSDNGADGSIWGSRTNEFRVHVNGLYSGNNLSGGGGRVRTLIFNLATFEETNISLGAAPAEYQLSGVIMNLIPKQGGNSFRGTLYADGTHHRLQSSNLSDELRARGLNTVNSVDKLWELNATVGGPIVKDRLWFFAGAMNRGKHLRLGANYWNKTPGTPFYTPDLTRPAVNPVDQRDVSGYLTWQASARQKFNVHHVDENYTTWEGIEFNPISPEAAIHIEYGSPNRMTQISWTSPVTSRLLLEAGVHMNRGAFYLRPTTTHGPFDFPIFELSTGYSYNGSVSLSESTADHNDARFAVSYVSGSHAFKAGLRTMSGENTSYATTNPLMYVFLNQAPVLLSERLFPRASVNRINMDMGIFAQDQWTMRRLTLNLGLRYDYFNGEVPAQHLDATRFLPAADFAPVRDVPNWKDLSPRLGAAYDLFGDHKTAIKGSLGRYVLGEATGFPGANNPVATIVNSTSRTWNDINGNYVPDCDLVNPATNGECGTFSLSTFGQPVVTTRYADDVKRGFGVRPYNWLATAELQHQLSSGLSAHVGYIHRWYGNFTVADNLAVGPEHFSPYSITAPRDPRLPGGGGYIVTGLYDVVPAKFGLADNLIRPASDFGSMTEVSDFMNLSLNGRFRNGATLSGGFDTGRTVNDRCFVVDSPQELRFCRVVTPFAAQTQLKLIGSYPLPWDFRVSANWQNSSVIFTAPTAFSSANTELSGAWSWATYVATNAEIAPSLGRDLAAGARGTTVVELVEPFSVQPDRINQLDVRLTKLLRFNRVRVELQADMYNAFNGSTIISMNTRFGPSWRPIQILQGRLVKFGAQMNF